ncbi:MAG: hypothetical protein ABGX20_22855 [Bacillus sp. (in: firmicutes)]
MKKFLFTFLGLVICQFLYIGFNQMAVAEGTNEAQNNSLAGWVQKEGNWYFYQETGHLQTGWLKDQGNWYFLNQNGEMETGWVQTADYKWYFLNKHGVMQTGWVQDSDSKWYFLNQYGAMHTGWVRDANYKWYYLNPRGAMETGWLQQGKLWYYLDQTGGMVTGWKWINNNWYYLGEYGNATTGWKLIKGSWYYFDSNSRMVKNNNAGDYFLTESGKMATVGNAANSAVAKILENQFDLGLSQVKLKQALGTNYSIGKSLSSDPVWLYALSVTNNQKYKIVSLDYNEGNVYPLLEGKASVLVYFYFESGSKNVTRIVINYFDEYHRYRFYANTKDGIYEPIRCNGYCSDK